MGRHLCSCIERLNIKMSTLSSDLHIQCHTSKSQWHFIEKIDKSILKFIRNLKGPQILSPQKKKERKRRTKLKDSYFLISKCISKLWLSNHCGTGVKTDK